VVVFRLSIQLEPITLKQYRRSGWKIIRARD